MRRLLMLLIACAAMTVVARSEAPLNDPGYGDGIRGNFGVFYSSLSPHGEWIDFNFGYAWRPAHVAHGWRPYLYGRWVWSDYGWYWVSEEPFGWATYHYGRWYYDDYYGWIWIPGDVWGPAWVEWRYDDDYIGWAPLSPYASFDVSIGITHRNHWAAPYNYWNFVPGRYFAGTRVVDYLQPVERTRRIFGNTRSVVDIRVDGDRVVNRGIDLNFVERRGNVHIDRVDVITRERGDGERLIRDGGRQRVEVFRPRLDAQLRSDASRPINPRRAEHAISFQGPGDQQGTGNPNRPDRTPDTRRDARIQERGQTGRFAPPQRKVDRAAPPERRIGRVPPPQRRIERIPPTDRRVNRAPGPERRGAALRPGGTRAVPPRAVPGGPGNPAKAPPREKPREGQDRQPRDRGR